MGEVGNMGNQDDNRQSLDQQSNSEGRAQVHSLGAFQQDKVREFPKRSTCESCAHWFKCGKSGWHCSEYQYEPGALG